MWAAMNCRPDFFNPFSPSPRCNVYKTFHRVPDKPVQLTILMPCLNEAETIACCIEKAWHGLELAGIAGEILIADNGSTDG